MMNPLPTENMTEYTRHYLHNQHQGKKRMKLKDVHTPSDEEALDWLTSWCAPAMPATVAADAHAIAAISYPSNCEELCSPVGSELGRNCGDGGRRWRERRPSFLRSWRACGWQKTHVVPNWLLFSQEWLCHTCEKGLSIMGHPRTLYCVRWRIDRRALTDLRALRKGLVGPFQYPQPILRPEISLPSATVSSTKASWRPFQSLPPTASGLSLVCENSIPIARVHNQRPSFGSSSSQ